MIGICLSLAPILRCDSLTETENVVLIVPTILEIIYSITLIVASWGNTGRNRFVLIAEGWIFFLLALLDVLSHTVSSARNSINIFKAFDIAIGALSFIPLMLYMVFVFLLLRKEFLPTLPERFQRILKFTFICFIPTVLLSELIGSFAGVSYRVETVRSSPILEVGFENSQQQLLWTFFSSLALALFTVYQTLAVVLVLYRLAKALIDQRDIETSSRAENQAYLFRGTGWVAIGLKLGLIETVIGFAMDGFGIAISRRVLRFISRACLTIGMVKGLDTVEDFRILTGRPRSRTNPNLRLLISNPRVSTFRRVSMTFSGANTPGAQTVEVGGQNPVSIVNLNESPLSQPPPTAGTSTSTSTRQRRRRSSRVTVNQTPGTAPTLQMRLSDLGLPTEMAAFGDSKKRMSRPLTEWYPSSFYAKRRSTTVQAQMVLLPDDVSLRSSMFSVRSDSSSVLKMPKPAFASTRQPSPRYPVRKDSGRSVDSTNPFDDAYSLESGVRRFAPRVNGNYQPPAGITREPEFISPERKREREHQISRAPSGKSLASNKSIRRKPVPAFLLLDTDDSQSGPSAEPASGPVTAPAVVATVDPFTVSEFLRRSSRSSSVSSRHSAYSLSSPIEPEPFTPYSATQIAQNLGTYEIPAVESVVIQPQQRTDEPGQVTWTISEAGKDNSEAAQVNPELLRIKSVGTVALRSTPAPTSGPCNGECVVEELEVIPSWEAYNVLSSTADDILPPSSPPRSDLVRQDSQVLSREDQPKYRR